MLKKLGIAAVSALALAAAAATTPAEAAGVKVGTLTCHVASGWGFVFGSSKDIRCVFRGTGRNVRFNGTIDKYGVDIGYTEGGVLVWAVFAPTSTLRDDALDGDYVGATAQATIAVGLGANVLIGGFDKSVALQPLSVEGMTGLNIAAGIGALNLKHVPR
jgi:hypothetical protein